MRISDWSSDVCSSDLVALNSMAFNLARSAGPAVGGAIVAVAGTAAAFAANAFSYLGLILVLVRWRPNLPERALPRERIGLAMAAGLRYVAMSPRSEEHTSELQSLMRISYAVFCLKKKKTHKNKQQDYLSAKSLHSK